VTLEELQRFGILVSIEAAAGDFCAAMPYARIANPTGKRTIPAQKSQNESEKASPVEMTLWPTEAAPYSKLAMLGLPKISAYPRPAKKAPRAISLPFNGHALGE